MTSLIRWADDALCLFFAAVNVVAWPLLFWAILT